MAAWTAVLQTVRMAYAKALNEALPGWLASDTMKFN
jgi:hypothetical protein